MDRQTDRPTDRQTDRQTNMRAYRAAIAAKNKKIELLKNTVYQISTLAKNENENLFLILSFKLHNGKTLRVTFQSVMVCTDD